MPTTNSKPKRILSKKAIAAIRKGQKLRWKKFHASNGEGTKQIDASNPKFPSHQAVYAVLLHLQESSKFADSVTDSFIDGYIRGYRAAKGIN